jgi:hypothetical protein
MIGGVGGDDLQERVPLRRQQLASLLVGQRFRQRYLIHSEQRGPEPLACLSERRQERRLAGAL